MHYSTERGLTKLVCSCGATAQNNSKERRRFFRRHPVKPMVEHFHDLAERASFKLYLLNSTHSKLLASKGFGAEYAKLVSESEQAIGAQRLVLEKLNYRASLANAN